jgi:plastocyanin
MRTQSTCLAVALLAGSLSTLAAAEISGKVKLNGTPPPEASMKMTDPVCSKERASDTVSSRHYVVGADKGLANVLVYIKEGAAPKAAPAEAVLLDQTKCEYQPYVMGMQAGQKIKVRNSDPTLHNVNAQPKINKGFNIGQPVKGMIAEKSFDKAEEEFIRIKCDVHPWMFAYVSVLDHPYFAVTDKDGNFKITGVPAGKYTLGFRHPKCGAKTQEVTLADSDTKTLDVTLDVPAPK